MFTIRRGKEIPCSVCGTMKYYPPSHIKEGKVYFCSNKCQGVARIGKENPFNPDKGNTVTFNCENCGKERKIILANYKKGKHHFCSRDCANKFEGNKKYGKDHHNWKEDAKTKRYPDEHKRARKEYREWRKDVIERDKYTCQDCRKKPKKPVAHHLKSFKEYPELRLVVSNGVTVCQSCHKKRHKEIGFETRLKSASI